MNTEALSKLRSHRSQLAEADFLGPIAAVLLGGFAFAFYLWQQSNPQLIGPLLSENALPATQRQEMLALLLAGMGAALLLWLAGSTVLAWRLGIGFFSVARKSSGLFLLAVVLPFVPVLSLHGIESKQPFLTVYVIVAMAFVAASTVYHVSNAFAGSLLPRWLVDSRAFIGLLLVAILSLAYVAFMTVMSVARHDVFLTHSYDLGIHDQITYAILHEGYMRSTQFGDKAINYFGDHFSPIFYLIAPLYALYQDARTLLVLQSLVLATAAVPIFLLVERKTDSVLLAVALAAGYLLHPALQGMNLFDFHQMAIAIPLLLVALYFVETERWKAFLAVTALALIVREEVALTVAAIGLYIIWAKREYVRGGFVVAAALVYFAIVTGYVMVVLGVREFSVRAVFFFAGLEAPGTSGYSGLAKTLITNPLYVLTYIFGNREKTLYLLQMFAPVLFLAVFAKKGWIAALPALAVALLASYRPQYVLGYHYVALPLVFVYFLTILGLEHLGRSGVRSAALAAGILVASLAMNYEFGAAYAKGFHGFPQPSPHQLVVETLLRQIPAEASVSTTSDYVPHVSARKEVYLFPTVANADYLVFDTAPNTNYWPVREPPPSATVGKGADPRPLAYIRLAPYLLSGQYGLFSQQDGLLLFKRGYDTSNNDEALRLLLSAKYDAAGMPSQFKSKDEVDGRTSESKQRIGSTDLYHRDGQSFLVYGPYIQLFPGKYRVEFNMKFDQPDLKDAVASVDAYSDTYGSTLKDRQIRGLDFPVANEYRKFALEFELDQELPDVEFRVMYNGQGELAVDSIEMFYLAH